MIDCRLSAIRSSPSGPVAPTDIRYVKLGPKNRWESASLEEGRIYFGWATDPHDLAARGDWDGVRRESLAQGQQPSAATANKTEMRYFYELGTDCLWITFARGHLWWGFAELEIRTLPKRLSDGRYHYRRIIGGWRNTDLAGEPIRIDRLSSSLTRVAAYRRTICKVAERDYLLRIINAQPDRLVEAAQAQLDGLATALLPIIERLHWSDFEVFVDLLLSREGWRRMGRLGGVQPDIDMLVELPATRERMAVQVKSNIDLSTARACSKKLHTIAGVERRAIAFHTGDGSIKAGDVELWDGTALARRAAQEGLATWLIEQAR